MGSVSLTAWVSYLFDRPVSDPAWHFELHAPWLDPAPERVAELIAETFERAGTLLQPFSGAQLNQGFWFLLGSSGHLSALTNASVAWPLRRRALHSFVPLFRDVMAPRCAPCLSHLDEPGATSLNSACYMWWDLLPIAPATRPADASLRLLQDEVLAVLTQLLQIPHDACRESALHGLGHWAFGDPRATSVIDAFLARTPDLR